MKELEKLLVRAQKPSRYIGGELNSIVKAHTDKTVTFAFCFPDSYEVGMSNLGLKILYHTLNSQPHIVCEMVFAPWDDMESEMRKHGYPLFALESKKNVSDFDIVGFTLQTELSYTNILNMLDLSGIPLLSRDRDSLSPLVIAGGSCAYNPEPLAEFIDLFVLGEGEEVTIELAELFKEIKDKKGSKSEFLLKASKISGIYVPSLYDTQYDESGKIKSFTPNCEGVPAVISKRIIREMDRAPFPESFILPYCDIVHDRAMLEVFRGCIRGCRFCQAGFIYRPVREKSPAALDAQAKKLMASTGYDEISLLSLSTSDYSKIDELADRLLSWCEPKGISLSLPSLRVDNFSPELLARIQKVRKGGLTFAPEAGTQRLRDIINKNVTEEELLRTCGLAFSAGYTSVKLYFMIGLPGETDEDVLGIADLATKVVDCFYKNKPEGRTKSVNVSVSVSSFVPKPFTPFQWKAQDTMEELSRKQQLLRAAIKSKKISLHWHDKEVSFLEAVFARGDRRLSKVILKAFTEGAKFDNWENFFNFELWMKAFKDCEIDPAFYACRERSYDELLPWDHIDIGVRRDFFKAEAELSNDGKTTQNCRLNCSGCGANTLIGGVCC